MSNNFNSSNLDIKCRIVLCKFNNKQIKQQHIHLILLQQLLYYTLQKILLSLKVNIRKKQK